ncbi:hypothetical protein EWE75_19380 [Sphingomonas populi]|uniref:Uncharacterized protein n=1 Tax=Sphingomonas populi TaxID=2484750 RepID=A0A4Q6XXE0_9SPHN|nr:hypothetical protein [Sphingomonas populi]RZF61166.1 hypothetical protein EWE75_19380 [Sphingomonas populi]
MAETKTLNERLTAIVTEGDAAWFAAHPDNRVRMRNAVAGEFSEEIGTAPVGMTWRCIIVEAQPGVRMRQPVALPMGVSNDMSDHQLFALFMQAAPPQAKRMIDQLRAAKLSGVSKPVG